MKVQCKATATIEVEVPDNWFVENNMTHAELVVAVMASKSNYTLLNFDIIEVSEI